MAASSSSALQCYEPLTILSSSVDHPQHDIFLSHSGFQKPFANALYHRLKTRYFTFFDITEHSLPLGEDFSPRIFHAARTCRLAVVVLSQEYLKSKWPMLELCAFFDAVPQPKIVPLFFKLAPADLKQEQNKEGWRASWEGFAKEDPKRIDVSKWELAFKKLSSYNGIALTDLEDESTYIDKVYSRICESLRPSLRHDFSGLQGIHRMCEVILEKFKELDQCKVCVLGMYGLPGIGKSTLCRYLCDYLFSEFAGKVLHLELPTDANDEQLLVKSKELLDQLANFNSKMDRSNFSHFRQVYHLLRGIDFSNSKVFLVVDNISSEKSQEFVKALLRLDLPVGSKVLMVARSESVVDLLLQEDELHLSSHNNVYDSMGAPSLNKEEALRVLLQFGDGVGLAGDYAPEAALTPRDWQLMEEVVNMSSFEGDHIPLVLKIMGEQLRQHKRQHKLDVENWCKTMTSSLTRVGMCREEALKQLVLQNFRALPPELQTLFLDVALFILPLSDLDGEFVMGDDAFLHLSLIQGCKQEEIEFEMQKLEKHGFLTVWQRRWPIPAPTVVFVHDFYLEFAASIKEASKYYWSSGLRWSKVQRNRAIEVAARNTELGLRTVVLELVEGCEEFKFPPQFSSVKSMVLRDCKSLKTLRGFENLTGLASVEICNCPSLKWVEPPATGCEQPYVRRFRWSNQEEKGRDAKSWVQQQELEALSMSKKPLWKAVRESLPQMGMMRRRVMEVDALLPLMRGLEVLRLENTGIRQLVELSNCLPELRVLHVQERHLKQFHVCNLPKLVCFEYIGDPMSFRSWSVWNGGFWREVYQEPRKGVMRRNFLAGCPNLQCVRVQCASLENGLQGITTASCNLKELGVRDLWKVSRLPDLTAVAESLEQLQVVDCPALISLNFRCMFRNLNTLELHDCPSVTEVTGLDGLPNLHRLFIRQCKRLKIVRGLGSLANVREFDVGQGCPNLQHCLVADLASLTEVIWIGYWGPWLMDRALNVREFANLETLSLMSTTTAVTLVGVENLNHLESLSLQERGGQTSATTTLLVDLASHSLRRLWLKGLRTLRSLEGIRFLDSLKHLELSGLPNLTSLKGIEFLDSLTNLVLSGLPNLTSLKGIEFLDSLRFLKLSELPNLTSLEGIESLRGLESLELQNCASVEELPSLSALGKLLSTECSGCDKLSDVQVVLLQRLRSVFFKHCESLARFPLTIRENWENWSIKSLSIEGSKFASVEALMAWLMAWGGDKEVPEWLRIASLVALRWELSESSNRHQAWNMVQDMLLLKAAERGYNNIGKEDSTTHLSRVATQLCRLARDYSNFKKKTMFACYYYCFKLAQGYYESTPRILEEALHCLTKLPRQYLVYQYRCNELVFDFVGDLVSYLIYGDTLEPFDSGAISY